MAQFNPKNYIVIKANNDFKESDFVEGSCFEIKHKRTGQFHPYLCRDYP